LIDLHCHLPFGLSDGPGAEEESLRILERAAAAGTTYINAVIHAGPDEAALPGVVGRLSRRAAELGIALHPGVEYDGFSGFGGGGGVRPFTVGERSRYMLIDLRTARTLFQAPQQVSELSARGIRAVIVHPEVLFSPSQLPLLRRLADADAVMQLNAPSLLPDAPAPVRDMARRCLDAGLCSLVASDAHRAEGTRRWRLDEAREHVARLYGESAALLLFEKNPARLLDDLVPPAWHPPKRKERNGWFSQLKTLFRRD